MGKKIKILIKLLKKFPVVINGNKLINIDKKIIFFSNRFVLK